VSLEELEKIAEFEARLKQRLIIPITELKPASFSSIVLLLVEGQEPPEPTIDVISFLARRHNCKVKLVCCPKQGVDCSSLLKSTRRQLEGKVKDVEEYVSEENVASFVSSITDSSSLIVIPLLDIAEEQLKLIESLFQIGLPILIIEKSDMPPKKLLGNVLFLLREPKEIKDPLPVLTAVCADKAKITFLAYIGESFLESIDFLFTLMSELSTVEKEKLVSSICSMMERAMKEVEPALVGQGFQLNRLIEVGSIDVASVDLMKKIGASLIAIPVKARMRPETKLVLMKATSSFLLIPEKPAEATGTPAPTSPKKPRKED